MSSVGNEVGAGSVYLDPTVAWSHPLEGFLRGVSWRLPVRTVRGQLVKEYKQGSVYESADTCKCKPHDMM